MSWRRTVLGPPGRGAGAWRFPITTVLGVGVAVFAALAGDWLTAGVAAALAALMGFMTVRAVRR